MSQRSKTHLRLQQLALAPALITILIIALSPQSARALDAKKDEKNRLLSCEANICGLILDKSPKDGWMTCTIGKTWGKRDIKKGAKQKDIGWKFGDAQCSVHLRLDRAAVLGALSKPKYEIRFRRHYVNCLVESGSGVEEVKVALAPKMKFKKGRVKKVWINVKTVDASPLLSSLIWTTAKLEDGLGIFHSEMVDEINDFVHKKCKKRYGDK